MYRLLKGALLGFLRAPTEPPEPPAGTPGSIQIFRASPQFLKLRIIGLAIVTALLVFFEFLPIAASMLASGNALVATLGGSVLVATAVGISVQYFLLRLDYDMRYYVVTDRSVRIRQGALLIRESTYTYANVQNLSIQQGPIERFFGISNLRIETAGGGGVAQPGQGGGLAHTGVLAGIENAAALRDRILELLRAYRDAGLGDREDVSGKGASGPGLSTERLREIRDELRALKAALFR